MEKLKNNNLDNTVRNVYLHYFMWYYYNKIDIDELCIRLRKLDRIINPHSKYYTGREVLDELMSRQ